MILRAFIVLLAGLAATQAIGQVQPSPGGLSMGQIRSPVLTIDAERFYTESLFGQRVADELQADLEALRQENQKIQEALTLEEGELTRRRPNTAPADFSVLAEEFDRRVEAIRNEQEAKQRDLQQRDAERRAEFFRVATPVLAEIMFKAGAAVILDERSVFFGVDAVDITEKAIEEVNSRLGDGDTDASGSFEVEVEP
jgi:Skp family chaperone for outer membrane proteins